MPRYVPPSPPIKVAVFPSEESIRVAFPLPSGLVLGDYFAQSTDGRCACSFPFVQVDINAIIERSGEIFDELPSDWEYPES